MKIMSVIYKDSTVVPKLKKCIKKEKETGLFIRIVSESHFKNSGSQVALFITVKCKTFDSLFVFVRTQECDVQELASRGFTTVDIAVCKHINMNLRENLHLYIQGEEIRVGPLVVRGSDISHSYRIRKIAYT